MADASFDAVMIGGGVNGLILGNYMAKNGMKVGIFEKNPELGGALCSSSTPVPGFIGDPCADMVGWWRSPVYTDFQLHERGLEIIFPEAVTAQVFPDGRCLVFLDALDWNRETGEVTPRMDVIQKNLREVARIAPKDAERMEKALEQYMLAGIAFENSVLNPPPLPGEPDPMDMLYDDPKHFMDRRYQSMTSFEVACDIYNSPEMRSFFLQWNAIVPTLPNYPTAPEVSIFGMLVPFGLAKIGMAKGGMHNIAHALQRHFSEYGGEFFVGAEVDGIIVKNGRAAGIKLADGTEIEARELVIDTAEIQQALNRHLRDYQVDQEIRRKVSKLIYDTGAVLWGGGIAFHDLPQYEAEAWNSKLTQARWIFMGDTDIDFLWREYSYQNMHIRPGHWPEKTYMSESPNSRVDPGCAPPGKHQSLVGIAAFPPASWLSETEWQQVKKEAVDEILKEWQRYAPNMTKDNVIASNLRTPYDHRGINCNYIEGSPNGPDLLPSQWGRNRPIPELAQYQVPGIENLWMASSSQHCSIGTQGFCSYPCYRRIAEKHDLWKPWEERGN
jgi:phytoene dehydrogenase-like protein